MPQYLSRQMFEHLSRYALSMLMRERRLHHLASTSTNTPQMIGLRFGTVIGISTVQRTDLFAVALARASAESGYMRVILPLSVRPVLHLNDLERAVRAIMATPGQARRFDIFNVASFHSTISRFSNELASLSGKRGFEVPRNQQNENSFAVNCTYFAKNIFFQVP